VADGTNAMLLGYRAMDLQPGEEVIICSHTYVATASAVHYAGGVPVCADMGHGWTIDPADIERLITPKTRAICPTQLNGRTANMDAIQAIANKHGLDVVEDAAQGLGSRFKGRCAGTFGLWGSFSLYPAKVLGCFGDGGAVVTNNDHIAERLRLYRDHGRNADGKFVAWGTNCRLDNLQAAILNRMFAGYDQVMTRRRKMAALYDELLSGLNSLQLPPAPDTDPRHFDVYQNYEIAAEQRDALREHLKQRGIGTLIQWGGQPVHQIEVLGIGGKCPQVDRFFERCLMLPLNMSLSDDDIRYVAAAIREFYSMSGHAAVAAAG
jgi:dTDP-4-amino-4,6-dideoxygalactose transaminase